MVYRHCCTFTSAGTRTEASSTGGRSLLATLLSLSPKAHSSEATTCLAQFNNIWVFKSNSASYIVD
ncbi:hypothetical protein TorRG33x02_192940 [Trema orientale]|uniref:Uncharacterized protein n=1 Tax=Trema orientale TaxID=63057 RepID=A0A2P5EH73_TREOI|nr:hypothetical protein TorRG33x02_192940 [Trema orientale]